MLSYGKMDLIVINSSLLTQAIYNYLKDHFLILLFLSDSYCLIHAFMLLLIFLILLHNLLRGCLSRNLNHICFVHQDPSILLGFNHLLLSYVCFLLFSSILGRLFHMEIEENMILLSINILIFKILI